MSDDLRDAFGEDIFAEPEEEFEEEGAESQNRTFLIAVAILGGLLLLALAAFAVWAFVVNPRMQAQWADEVANAAATNTAVAEMVANGGTVTSEAEPPASTEDEDEEDVEETPEDAEPTATETPEPTNTPVIRATNTPTPTPDAEEAADEEGGEEENGEEVAAGDADEVTATPTSQPRRSPTPTRTPTASEEEAAEADETPETGLGELLLVLAGGLLIGLIILVRRLRST